MGTEPPPTDNFTWSFDDQTGSELSVYRILKNGLEIVNTNRSGSGSFNVKDKNVIQIVMNMEFGDSATSQLDEGGILIYDESVGKVPQVLDSGSISVKIGREYIATGVIIGK